MNPLRPVEDPVPNSFVDRLIAIGAIFFGLYGAFITIVVVSTVPHLGTNQAVPALHKITLWFYLAAHSIAFHVTVEGNTFAYPIQTVPGWSQTFRILPPIALFLGGVYLARKAPLPNEFRGFVEGAKLSVLYAPVSILLGLLTYHRPALPPVLQLAAFPEDGELLLTTDLFGVALVAGVVYPVVFAGFGGAAVYELQQHLDRPGSGYLHRLDRWFSTREGSRVDTERTESPLLSAIVAGSMLTVAQVPGFLLTVFAFQNPHQPLVDPLFQGATFPYGGYALFVSISFVLGASLWLLLIHGNGIGNTTVGFNFGFFVGGAVFTLVWSIGYIAREHPGGLVPSAEIVLFLVLLYTIGWLQSLGGALMGVALVQHRLKRRLFT
jgi:hypothetical protein